MAFARLIVAVIAAVGSLVLGLALPDLGLGYAFSSTLPLTLGGIGVYTVCRLQLAIFASKSKRYNKKK